MKSLSDFIRNATPEQKEKVMGRVLQITEYEQRIQLLTAENKRKDARIHSLKRQLAGAQSLLVHHEIYNL